MRRSCSSNACCGIHQQHHHFGKADGVDGVGDGKLFQLLLDARRPPQARGVVQAERSAPPLQLACDGVAGDAGLGAGEHAVLAEQPVHQRRLAGVRPPDDGDANGARRGCFGLVRFVIGLCLLRRRLRQRLAQRLEQIHQPFAMLGRDRDRVAEPERMRFEHARRARLGFGLVRNHDHGLARAAHQIGEGAVVRHRAGFGIEHEEHRVGLLDGLFGLRHHPAGKAFGAGVLEARGVDDGEVEIAEPRLPLAPVARDARQVVDQSEPLADQPVEQRGLADVRPPDDGDGEAHGHWMPRFGGA